MHGGSLRSDRSPLFVLPTAVRQDQRVLSGDQQLLTPNAQQDRRNLENSTTNLTFRLYRRCGLTLSIRGGQLTHPPPHVHQRSQIERAVTYARWILQAREIVEWDC